MELSKEEEQRALDIHRKAIVIDGLHIINAGLPEVKKGEYFEKMRKAGVTATNTTIGWFFTENFRQAIDNIADWYRLPPAAKNQLLLATTAKDVEKAKKTGKYAAILGFQNTKMIEEDIGLLQVFYNLGVRILQLTYNFRNFVGDGCNERTDAGLSRFGVQVVEEMNRLHMLIDLSHVGPVTTNEAIDISKNPVAFTHACPRSITDSVRNKTDEQIKALAEKGGVMGICAWSPICYTKYGVRPTVDDFMTHVDYVVNLVGVEHVGIGLDLNATRTKEYFDSFKSKYPEIVGPFIFETYRTKDLDEASLMPNVTRGLVARGYSDQEIFKILGGNFLELFRRVWRQ